MKQANKLRAQAADLAAKANAFEAYGKLQKAARCIFDARNTLDFPDYLDAIDTSLEDSMRAIARRLGHDQRVDLLVRAGMDRERAEIGDLIDDDTAAVTLATWIFDIAGRWHENYEGSPEIEKIREVFPMGVKFWKEGRHDT